jgi:glycerol-3-phosphate acyltransferase PlsY
MEVFFVNYSLICLLSYLIGSIPFSYILTKRIADKDITKSGTGNAGAMNSYEVTGSKKTGIIVLILDFLKGLFPALILTYILELSFSFSLLPLILIIAGHNFSIFLKFKGGRGLATSAGISLVINFWLVILWLTVFFIMYMVKKNIHIGNIFATILLPIFVTFTGDLIIKLNFLDFNGIFSDFNLLFTYTAMMSLQILIKHLNPLIEIITEYKKNK